jgi:hypothetical protein
MPDSRYPAWRDWLRDHQPPLQVIPGCYDPSFQVEEAEAYRRDVPGAEVYVLDAGAGQLARAATSSVARSISSSVL